MGDTLPLDLRLPEIEEKSNGPAHARPANPATCAHRRLPAANSLSPQPPSDSQADDGAGGKGCEMGEVSLIPSAGAGGGRLQPGVILHLTEQ